MLAKLHHVLRKAQRGRYAVGAFNVSNLEQAQAVVTAASRERSPVIINTSEKAIEYAGLEELAALVTSLAKKFPIPVVLNLDHGRHLPLVKSCLAAGYGGIMFDGSRLPSAQNIRDTATAVRWGHARGVGVEGEIGQVKYLAEIKQHPEAALTDPDEAADFVRRTNVDALAVAIGNAHGVPLPHERLDFRRLQAIGKLVRVPLVLHGASGTPPASLRRAIRLGICKVNIDTDLRLAFTGAVRSALRRDPDVLDPRDLLSPARDAVAATVTTYLRIFGSSRRAT